jgi:hypothetical protein
MDIFLRIIAITIEVAILAGIMYALLRGVMLIIFDLGVSDMYKKMVTLLFGVIGVVVVFFFIAHLTAFYPVIGISW